VVRPAVTFATAHGVIPTRHAPVMAGAIGKLRKLEEPARVDRGSLRVSVAGRAWPWRGVGNMPPVRPSCGGWSGHVVHRLAGLGELLSGLV